MTTTTKTLIAMVAVALLLSVGMAYAGSVSNRRTVNNAREQVNYSFFSATTTNATSTNIGDGTGALTIAGAKRVTFYLSRGGTVSTNTGTSTFNIQVTPDGTNWYNFNKMEPATTTADVSGHVAHLGALAIQAATSTIIAAMDLEMDTFYQARCIVVETIDGEHSCSATVEY